MGKMILIYYNSIYSENWNSHLSNKLYMISKVSVPLSKTEYWLGGSIEVGQHSCFHVQLVWPEPATLKIHSLNPHLGCKHTFCGRSVFNLLSSLLQLPPGEAHVGGGAYHRVSTLAVLIPEEATSHPFSWLTRLGSDSGSTCASGHSRDFCSESSLLPAHR